jgi:hypothetical protein
MPIAEKIRWLCSTTSFSGGNWVTGLAIGVGAVIVLPMAAPILRPLAKTAIEGGSLAYRGAAELIENIGDLVAEAIAETGHCLCSNATVYQGCCV